MLSFEKYQFLMKKMVYECNKIGCTCCLLVQMIVHFLNTVIDGLITHKYT